LFLLFVAFLWVLVVYSVVGGFVWWFDECGFGGLLMAGSRWVLFGCLVCDDGGLWVTVFLMMVA
jgi:hypothetical protein